MYQERWRRVIAAMDEQQWDMLALVPGANLAYLTGLDFHISSRLTLALLPAEHEQPLALVLPLLEQERAQRMLEQNGLASVVQCECWHDADGPTGALLAALNRVLPDGPPLIGIEYTAMRVSELRALEQAGSALRGSVATRDASGVLARLRMVKDAAELAAMETAVQIIEHALQQVLEQIRPGITERQLGAIWTQAINAAGADAPSFDCIVASGPNSALPHHGQSKRPLQHGDLIVLDGGARYRGYVSDITRTVALAEPGETARVIYELVRRANAAGQAAVRPGVTGEQIDRAVRQVIIDGGYADAFVHRTGHGLGLECHEAPYLTDGSQQALPVGTTFTIEPGIYLPGLGGVRIEDDMVITADGGRSLTSFTRELLIL
ncbi:MAG: aminopeptidase P family protein [Chloroflexaceae bacterium]|nr:aminopeptidase P family protein [Chloroflexaceae bacterium]